MTQLSEHFSMRELTVTRTGLPNVPTRRALERLTATAQLLEEIRALLGELPIDVTSGFRSEAVNRAVGGATQSQHLLGEAADIRPRGRTPEDSMRILARAVLDGDLVVDQLIVYPGGKFLHVSRTTRRANRGELLRSGAPSGSGGPYSAYVLA